MKDHTDRRPLVAGDHDAQPVGDILTVAAINALRSYEYGNSSPDLAKSVADKLSDARHAPITAFSEPAGAGDVRGEAMSLRVALDFADNPRPHHTMAAPADTNGELYGALRVLAAAYRSEPSQPAAPADDKCATCNGHGMIGGPSYYAPDEGGDPCPDCAAQATAPDDETLTARAAVTSVLCGGKDTHERSAIILKALRNTVDECNCAQATAAHAGATLTDKRMDLERTMWAIRNKNREIGEEGVHQHLRDSFDDGFKSARALLAAAKPVSVDAYEPESDITHMPDGKGIMQVWFECDRDVFTFYDRIRASMPEREAVIDKEKIAQVVHTDCTLIPGATFYSAAELAIDATLAALKRASHETN